MTTQELKNSILQLAIQGGLVEQRPEEGTAQELYRQIQAEQQRLIQEKKLKKKKPLPEITEDEKPFEIPESWMWVRHNDLFEIVGGSQPPKSQFKSQPQAGDVRLYQIRDYGETPVPIYVARELVTKFSREGDILLARYGGSIGKVFWAKDGAYNVAMAKVCPLYETDWIYNPYIYFFYLAPLYQTLVKNNSRSAQSGFNQEDFNRLLFPLPPFAEQQRIVARIEELRPLVDRYEAAWTQLEDFNRRFPEDMKKSILQQAVQGKLVEQRPEEGTAQELYWQIQAEKQRLIQEKKIKKEKPLPEITVDEKPFEIPESWMWVRLRDIVFNRGQTTPKSRFSYIDIGSIDNKRQVLSCEENLIEADQAPSRARKIVEKGDILYSTVRPYLHNMCIVDRSFSHKPIASTGFAVLTCHEGLFNRYLFYYLMAPSFDGYANSNENAKGVAYPAINDDRLYRAVVPLPPLAEQKRIVARIEELLPLCERLK